MASSAAAGGDVIEERPGAGGAVNAAPPAGLLRRCVLRSTVLAGGAVVAWLLCGSAVSHADSGPAIGSQSARAGAARPAAASTVDHMPTVGALAAVRTGGGLGATLGAVPVLSPATAAVDRPVDRIASGVPVRVARPTASLAHVAQGVTDLAPAAPLLRPVDGDLPLPARLPAPVLHPLASSAGAVTGGSVTGVATGLITGPSTSPAPVDVAGPADHPAGSGQRPSAVPLPASQPVVGPAPVRSVPANAAPGPRAGESPPTRSDARQAHRTVPPRSPARPVPLPPPGQAPGDGPLSVPAAPGPVGAGGQPGPSAPSAAALPVDGHPDPAHQAGARFPRTRIGTVRQRADDPSVTPD